MPNVSVAFCRQKAFIFIYGKIWENPLFNGKWGRTVGDAGPYKEKHTWITKRKGCRVKGEMRVENDVEFFENMYGYTSVWEQD